MVNSISTVIDQVQQIADGLIHADDVFYPLLIQALYPEHVHHTQSYMGLLHRVLDDPSPAQIVFLPDFIQERFQTVEKKEDILKFYPEDHPERIAFLNFRIQSQDVWTSQPLHIWIRQFEAQYLKQQRQYLFEQGVRVVDLDQGIDHSGPHTVVLSRPQSVPQYLGEVATIVCDADLGLPRTGVQSVSSEKIPPLRPQDKIPAHAVRLLFNEPDLFYERYILKISPPYHSTNHLGTKAVRQYLLQDVMPKTNTVFDQHQLQSMKAAWEEFKGTLPGDVVWNSNMTRHNIHGTIDLIWNGGVYQITRTTPPSRNALLKGVDPELPILGALYDQPLTHLGYIHIKGHGQDAIQITRYTNPQELIDSNLDKLATYYDSGPKEEPA